MKIHNFEQGTDEWFAIRNLRGTGSKATAIRVAGKGLETLAKELVLAHYNGRKDHYTSPEMERGNELEPQARMAYEFETGNSVREVGFIEHETSKHAGCSPDGLVGEDGGTEFKCINSKKYFDYIIDGLTPETGHMDQMQFCMWVSKRDWWDYGVYNPDFPQPILITRVYADKDMFKKFEKGIEKLEELIKKYIKVYESKQSNDSGENN